MANTAYVGAGTTLGHLHMMTIMKQISKTVFQRSSAPTII